MLHPSQTNMVKRGSLANSRVEIVMHGKAAHAAGAPDIGVNALEAIIQTFVGVNGRRLHMREDARVHGIITAGGIDTDALSSKTMESKKVPGLYFIGEVVDVTGHLGGFNFQWAWASGFCAGQAL